MPYFNIVAETSENTVVTEYEPVKKRSDSYQSEAALEQEFIRMLCEQGYEYLPIHTESDLVSNLRRQLEELNHYTFSDTEWEDFFHNAIANPNEHIVEKTRKIQEDHIQNLRRDDGSTKNITLIDKKNIHNNRLQVINQYVVSTKDGAKHDNRYDVTVLVNGFPLVHIELKRRGVAIGRLSIRLSATRGSLSGRAAGCMNTSRFLLSPTERIQNIILTVPGGMQSGSIKRTAQVRLRAVTVLSLPASGQMPIIV